MNGVPETLENVVLKMLEIASPDIDKLFAGDISTPSKVFHYKNNINFKKLGIPAFFKNFELILSLKKISSNEKPGYRGSYYSNASLKKKLVGGWKVSPKIKLTIWAKNADIVKRMFVCSLTHELTHSYMDLCYSQKNNKNFIKESIKRRGGNIYAAEETGSDIGNVFYLLYRPERNAYLAQLQEELSLKKNKIKDKKTLNQALKSTIPWRHYKWLDRNITEIINETDEHKQKVNMEDTEKIMDKHFNNYSQFQKYMSGRFKKWEKAFLTKSSKIAYNVYEKVKK